jgi:hypothetical protein
MKDNIIKVMDKYDFKLSIEEDNGLMFEGPMSTKEQLNALTEELFAISKDLDLMVFQIDDTTLMIAVFYELPMM